ncbi:MAG: YceD family protein [Burkholderiales bacterium]
MSAPAVIDSLEFARSEQQTAGELPIAVLKRLHDVLIDTEGSLRYALRGSRDDGNRLQLHVTVGGGLRLQCQRCLEPLDYALEIASTLLLVPRGEQPEEDLDDPEAPDAIEASTELDVTELIEDEVLLSLSLSPRHAEGACTSRTRGQEAGLAAPSAFSQLAALKRAGDNP